MTSSYTEEWLAAYQAKRAGNASGKASSAQIAIPQKRAKYGNRKTEVEGIVFDSAKEAARWQELCLLQRAGEISNLERQVKFSLDVNGEHIANYICDFVYDDEQGDVIVEDVKSSATKTRLYEVKKKLMKAIYRISILEF